jgi:peptidyl-prolyl cis-trans isomerase SurA
MIFRASLLYIAFLTFCLSTNAQDIVSFGNNHVTRQEFMKAFSKNNTEQHLSEKAYRDYLELYIRFKLKVKAAYDLKMDTLANQKAELNEFRRQIEEGFLSDEASVKSLVTEAFSRSQKDIHLCHIFIAFDGTGIESHATIITTDTVKSWKLVETIYHDLEKGADFGKLASTYSSDPSASENMGDIGYITSFTLPYPLENLAYSTPPGKFSKPYRSKTGYHIFKNMGERKALGKLKAAQIVLVFPPDAGTDAKLVVKHKADSIYNALSAGASFTEMADRFSNDINVPLTHGVIPEFGVGSFDPGFEKQVFALTENGALTHPIETSVGYYIIKRLERVPVNTDAANDSAMAALKQQVRKDSRIDLATKAMLARIRTSSGFKKTTLPENALVTYVENSLNNKSKPSAVNDKSLLFSFPHQQLYAGDFKKYLQALRARQDMITVQTALAQYQEIMMREYYRNRLEDFNPDFAAQLKEFKEGNLLFEIMQHKVWDKASADSSGLLSFYNKNKDRYWWESSADAIIFSCADSTVANGLKPKLEKNIRAWKETTATYETKVQADSGRFELTQLPIPPQQKPVPGQLTEPIKNAGDNNNISFVYFIKQYPPKQPRSFEDAKGFVLNDYQAFLEDKWISTLKAKYPVKINEAVFRSLLK